MNKIKLIVEFHFKNRIKWSKWIQDLSLLSRTIWNALIWIDISKLNRQMWSNHHTIESLRGLIQLKLFEKWNASEKVFMKKSPTKIWNEKKDMCHGSIGSHRFIVLGVWGVMYALFLPNYVRKSEFWPYPSVPYKSKANTSCL